MRILLCCEHFYPLGGGVSKMMHEIGARLVGFGHEVEVATSHSDKRRTDQVDGMKIHSFRVSGNAVNGMQGDLASYQSFLVKGQYDCLLVMAAQQWTFDGMIEVLDQIPYKKLHIPCGYSSFYLPRFHQYYDEMRGVVKKFDHLIYNSTNYRDINFARENGCKNIHVIPAGASEFEFNGKARESTKAILGIPKDEFTFLSVGAPAYHKGHKEVLKAYQMANLNFPSTLVLNGNYDDVVELSFTQLRRSPKVFAKELAQRLLGVSSYNIKNLAQKEASKGKRVIFSNLGREELISLFHESDLFLFPSHIEYSPLVIFECLGAGLPFLSVPVGNVEEIIEWSSAGEICRDVTFKKGRTFVNPKSFSLMMEQMSTEKDKRVQYAQNGKKAFAERFNWTVISRQIEKVMSGN